MFQRIFSAFYKLINYHQYVAFVVLIHLNDLLDDVTFPILTNQRLRKCKMTKGHIGKGIFVFWDIKGIRYHSCLSGYEQWTLMESLQARLLRKYIIDILKNPQFQRIVLIHFFPYNFWPCFKGEWGEVGLDWLKVSNSVSKGSMWIKECPKSGKVNNFLDPPSPRIFSTFLNFGKMGNFMN